MAMPWGALGAGLGQLAGSGLSAGLGWAAQEDAQDFAKTLAKKQIRWRVNDLRAAGLNPILAATGGGFGGGASAGAPMMRPPDIGAGVGNALRAGKELQMFESEKKRVDEQAQAAKYTSLNQRELGILHNARTEVERINKEIAQYNARTANANAKMAEFNLPEARTRRDYYNSETGRTGQVMRHAAEDYGFSAATAKDLVNPFSRGKPRLRGRR